MRGKLAIFRLFSDSLNLTIQTSDNAVRYKIKIAIDYLAHLKMLESPDFMTISEDYMERAGP